MTDDPRAAPTPEATPPRDPAQNVVQTMFFVPTPLPAREASSAPPEATGAPEQAGYLRELAALPSEATTATKLYVNALLARMDNVHRAYAKLERDALTNFAAYKNALARVATLEARLRDAERAFAIFGAHVTGCAKLTGHACDCGLDLARATPPVAPAP